MQGRHCTACTFPLSDPKGGEVKSGQYSEPHTWEGNREGGREGGRNTGACMHKTDGKLFLSGCPHPSQRHQVLERGSGGARGGQRGPGLVARGHWAERSPGSKDSS